jgi:hypothetical protein
LCPVLREPHCTEKYIQVRSESYVDSFLETTGFYESTLDGHLLQTLGMSIDKRGKEPEK